MGIFGLFNKRCSWKRKVITGENKFGENIYTEQIVESDVPCRAEDVDDWELQQRDPGGDFTRVKKIFYMGPGKDIQGNDRIIFEGSDNYIVIKPDDAAGHGHHLEVRVEQTVDL